MNQSYSKYLSMFTVSIIWSVLGRIRYTEQIVTAN